ncbi:MAG: ABC transporter substrate-binding protein [Planctomycetota bacterium]
MTGMLIALGAAVSLPLLASCDRPAPAQQQTQSVSTEVGETPRIVALLPFAADQLLELGVTPIAVPLIRGNTPEAWEGIPRVTVDHSAGPNIEQLIATRADVIVTSSVYAQFVPAIERATDARVLVMDVDSVEHVKENIAELGEIAGVPDEAASRIAALESRLGDRDSASQPVEVLGVFGTPHAFYAFLPDSYLGDLVEHAGGRMITGDLESHSVFRGLAPLSMEVVLERDPDLLLVVFHGSPESAQAMLEGDALWSRLSAVEEGRVVFLQDDLYAMRPGSELPRAMEEIEGVVSDVREQLR